PPKKVKRDSAIFSPNPARNSDAWFLTVDRRALADFVENRCPSDHPALLILSHRRHGTAFAILRHHNLAAHHDVPALLLPEVHSVIVHFIIRAHIAVGVTGHRIIFPIKHSDPLTASRFTLCVRAFDGDFFPEEECSLVLNGLVTGHPAANM